MGLEQSPAYYSRRVRSMSRTPDREERARSLSQPRSTSSPVVLDLESTQGTGQCPLFRVAIKWSYHQEGENLNLHPLEVDPDLLPNHLPPQREGVLNLCGSNR